MCVFTLNDSKKQWSLLYEFIFNNSQIQPSFAYNCQIPVQILTDMDPNQPFRLEIWNYSGGPKFLGEVITSYNNLYIKQREFNLVDQVNTVPSNCPKLQCLDMVTVQTSTALDFFKSGIDLKTTFAIDFTHNNGTISNKTCLHYLQKNDYNYYERALFYFTNMLLYHNTAETLFAYGFGAIPPSVEYGPPGISQCFNLQSPYNQHTFSEFENLLDCYQKCAMKSQYMGVSQFCPILTKTLQNMKDSGVTNQYNVLIYLASSEPEDLQSFIQLAKDNILQPISILIIGIGEQHSFDKLWKHLQEDIYKLSRRFILFLELNHNMNFDEPFNQNQLNQLSTHINDYYFFHNQILAKENQKSYLKK